jgi:hypothetical protein
MDIKFLLTYFGYCLFLCLWRRLNDSHFFHVAILAGKNKDVVTISFSQSSERATATRGRVQLVYIYIYIYIYVYVLNLKLLLILWCKKILKWLDRPWLHFSYKISWTPEHFQLNHASGCITNKANYNWGTQRKICMTVCETIVKILQ